MTAESQKATIDHAASNLERKANNPLLTIPLAPLGERARVKGEPISRGFQDLYMNETIAKVNGFLASAVESGLKKHGGLDLALIYSEKEATVAGVFTTNLVKAAPVVLSRQNVRNGKGRAIIVNSGNANACTGRQGFSDAVKTTELTAAALGIPAEEVFAASTGVIGQPLKMDRIAQSVHRLVDGLSPDGISQAARAIMTTDSFPKLSAFEGLAGGSPYRILGMAKGAGMIMPNMATMLCFILSDVAIGQGELRQALSSGVQSTFNRITVDGDTSTNDTVLVMANGRAENGPLGPSELHAFAEGLQTVMGELSKMIVRDGEGATKLVSVEIRGAKNPEDAQKAARTVANSSLVKTALYGQDANWGRIMAALGRAGVAMKEESVDIWVDDVQIVAGGLAVGPEAEGKAAEKMRRKEFSLAVDLRQGAHSDRILTCDLTHEYVSINADYRT